MKHSAFLKQALLLAAIAINGFVANAQILWKISGNGAKNSYVLGTHHVAPAAILDSIDGFDDAFSSCTRLYGEVNMENATK